MLGRTANDQTLNTRDVINYLLFDCNNPSSVKSCLAAARRNGRAQRTSLTRDMWESLNSAWIEFSNINPLSVTAGELPRVLDWVRSRSALYRGALLPEIEMFGGGVDNVQCGAILRSLSAHRSYRCVYKQK
jgi:uncharacterized alpha-E superfamily protein